MRKIRSSCFIKKGTLPQMFSGEFCEIYKNTFSNRTPQVAACEKWKIVKAITMQKFFCTSYWKQCKRSLYTKCVQKGLCINSIWCLVHVTAIKNTSSKQQIRSKTATISALQVFIAEIHPQFHFPGFFLNTRST